MENRRKKEGLKLVKVVPFAGRAAGVRGGGGDAERGEGGGGRGAAAGHGGRRPQEEESHQQPRVTGETRQ